MIRHALAWGIRLLFTLVAVLMIANWVIQTRSLATLA